MLQKEEVRYGKDNRNVDDLATKGRWPSFIKLFAVIGVTSGIGEVIGKITIPVGIGSVIILPMVFAMILALLLTPDALGGGLRDLKISAAGRRLISPAL